MRILREDNIHRKLEETSAKLEAGIREVLKKLGLRFRMNRVGSMMSLFFTEKEVTDFPSAARSDVGTFKAYFRDMLANGIYLAPSAFEASFVSAAHDERDVERTVEACRASLKRLSP